MALVVDAKTIARIKRLRKSLSLVFARENLDAMVRAKKRTYSLLAKQFGHAVFLKTALARGGDPAKELINEIAFHLSLKNNPAHPLNKFVPKIIAWSLDPDFPFLLRASVPGVRQTGEDIFSYTEIKKISGLLSVIRNSPTDNFFFIPKKRFFSSGVLSTAINGYRDLPASTIESLKSYPNNSTAKFSAIEPALSHGDFSEGNMVITPSGQIEMIDWNRANLRNPLYDLADFWIKRRRRPAEQKELISATIKEFDDTTFCFLFSEAVIEIVLRDLKLFDRMLARYVKEKRFDRFRQVETEKKEYLSILNETLK